MSNRGALTDRWMAMARSSLAAARACVDSAHYRSAASRAYYAVFAAAHARLIRARQTPRVGLGTWSHSDLPDAMGACLAKRGKKVAAISRQLITRSRKLRELADYGAQGDIDLKTALQGIADATAALRDWSEIR